MVQELIHTSFISKTQVPFLLFFPRHSFFLQPVALSGLCALSLLNLIIMHIAAQRCENFSFFRSNSHTTRTPQSFPLLGFFLSQSFVARSNFTNIIIVNVDRHSRMIFQRCMYVHVKMSWVIDVRLPIKLTIEIRKMRFGYSINFSADRCLQ